MFGCKLRGKDGLYKGVHAEGERKSVNWKDEASRTDSYDNLKYRAIHKFCSRRCLRATGSRADLWSRLRAQVLRCRICCSDRALLIQALLMQGVVDTRRC